VPQGSWTGGLARCAVQTARASRALHRVHTFNEAKKCWTGCLACGGSACWAGWEIIFVDDDRPDGAASAARDLTRTDCAASSHCDSPNCPSSFARAATASPNSNSLIVFKYLGLLLTKLFRNGLSPRLFSTRFGVSGLVVRLWDGRLGLFSLEARLLTSLAMTSNFALNNQLTHHGPARKAFRRSSPCSRSMRPAASG